MKWYNHSPSQNSKDSNDLSDLNTNNKELKLKSHGVNPDNNSLSSK